MPWTLTTPVAVGDLDTGTYGEAKIVRMRHIAGQLIQVDLEYGNTISDVWTKGVAPPVGKEITVNIVGAEYANITANSVPDVQTSDPSNANYVQVGAVWVERTYVATKRGLYEWLGANGYLDAGSVT